MLLDTKNISVQKPWPDAYSLEISSRTHLRLLLWSPSKVGEIQQLEDIQKAFTRKIQTDTKVDYWERLQKYHLYSLERRRERYQIIYMWKILEGMVPNLTGRSQIKEKSTFRFGRTCVVPPVATAAKTCLQRLCETSFCVKGPKLFNSLPSHL